MTFEYNKQPWEEEVVAVDFVRRIPVHVTIVAPVDPFTSGTYVSIEEIVSLTGALAANYSGHLEYGTPFLAGVVGKEKTLATMISGGVSGFKYRLSFRITLSDSQKKEDDVWVIVKET